jgi:hypothetical protein
MTTPSTLIVCFHEYVPSEYPDWRFTPGPVIPVPELTSPAARVDRPPPRSTWHAWALLQHTVKADRCASTR